MSAPQTNTHLGGSNGTTISTGGLGGGGDGNSSLPGAGYPSEYQESHSNDTAPTSPTLGGGSITTVQNSTSATNICDCNQSGGNDNGNGSGGSDNGNADGGSPVGGNPVESQQ